jgi:hypothetical protein
MSSIITEVLNSTISLLCTKLRDYTAQTLNKRNVNEEKCRHIVVGELDDIKSTLDGLSRKDLLASLSFFKEGVTRLYIFLDASFNQFSTSNSCAEDESELEGATETRAEQSSATQAERDASKFALQLSRIFGNLKTATKERYNLAKKSFEETRRLATEAFNNVALSTEDRIMASKLRIASRILESLDDTEAAIRDCLLYLKELQDLSAIQAMFAVRRDSGKGITSRLRASINLKKRNVNIESIQMINALLIDLTMKFTNIKMGVLNWPTIKIGKSFHHPLLHDEALERKLKENEAEVPWFWKLTYILPVYCALTSKGEILSAEGSSLWIRRSDGESELFFIPPSKTRGCTQNEIRRIAVDKNDNVYLIVEILPRKENGPPQYKLLILNANGEIQTHRFLPVIDEELRDEQISATNDGTIVIYCHYNKTVYICDNVSIKKDYKFLVPIEDVHPGKNSPKMIVSDKNEIISTICKHDGSSCMKELFMYFIAMNGKIKRELQVPITTKHIPEEVSVVFSHLNETMLVSLIDGINYSDDVRINSFSTTGELLHYFHIPRSQCGGVPNKLISHPNGPIALIGCSEGVMLQM